MENMTGKVWVLGDDIDTDIIIPTEYLAMKTIDDMKQYCGDKADKMKEFVQTTPASTTYHSTPSAEDVTNRAGTKPTIYSTNEYNSAGENRASRASKTPKRITVTVDANGKVNGADKIPHIDRPASTQQHISNDTIM